MPNLLFFTVTQQDIDTCPRRDARNCPVVTALLRAAKKAGWVGSVEGVYVERAAMPKRILDYMNRADKGYKLRPRTFVFDMDDVSVGGVWGWQRPIPL